MSESGTRHSRLENFDANKAEVAAKVAAEQAAAEHAAFEQALYGDAGTGDDLTHFTDEDRQRLEEGNAYERHLEAMADGTHKNGFDDLVKSSPSRVEQLIEDTPRLRMANELAEQVAELRGRSANLSSHFTNEERISALQDRVSALLERYTRTPDADLGAVDLIFSRLGIENTGEAIDKLIETRDGRRVSDTDQARREADAEAARRRDSDLRRTHPDLVRNIDQARDQAYTEYETREGSAYDVDMNRVQDIDQARDEAIEEAKGRVTNDERNAAHDQAITEYEARTGAPYDVDAGRVADVNQAHDEALAEYETREGRAYNPDEGRSENNDATRDEALAEHEAKGNSLDEINDAGAQYEADQRDLMLQTRDDELREGLEQREADRNNGDHWWSSPMARLAGVLTVRSWSLRERIENSSPRNRRLAIGVLGAVGIAGIAILVKNNIHTGGSGGGGHHDAARSAADAGQHGAGNHNQHVELPPQHGSTVEFSDAAHHVNSGKGWLEQLDDMKVPRLEQPGLLAKILNSDDPGIKDWVYKMGDGNPGMSHTGSMPQSVLESINALR